MGNKSKQVAGELPANNSKSKSIGKMLSTYYCLPDLSPLVFQVFWRNFVVFRKIWKANIMFNFIEPLLYLSAMGLGLGAYVREINGLPYINYLASGLVASSAMWATSYECTYGSFIRMDFQKTYHAIIATPASVADVVTGDLLYGAFKSVLYGSVILIVNLLIGIKVSPWALLLPLVLVIAGLLFAVLALTWTSLAPNFDFFNYYFTLIITPMFLFSGVFFPLEGVPQWAQYVAWFTPLYHVVELSRGLILGKITLVLWGHLAWITVLTVLLFNVPIVRIRERLLP
jgi:lipooligosaccharide transport system permease protein